MKLDTCHFGDVRAVLRDMIAAGVKVQTIVTSPPYWGLRSYLPAGHPDKALELGSEPTFGEFLRNMVEVFNLAREVLAEDGTMWVNMGDSYAGARSGPDTGSTLTGSRRNQNEAKKAKQVMTASRRRDDHEIPRSDMKVDGLKPKDLIGQPWRLAFALQDAGWWLRQDIIWHKPNPMPESAKDRCTKAHEYIFLLAKSRRYYFDADAIKEPVKGSANPRRAKGYISPSGWNTAEGAHGTFHPEGREKGTYERERPPKGVVATTGNDGAYADGKSERMGRGPGWRTGSKYGDLSGQNDDGMHRTKAGLNKRKLAEPGTGPKNNTSMDEALWDMVELANKRSVWTVQSEPYPEAHFATFPMKLIEPCILAGSRPGDTVLDIFMGSGTVAQAAQKHGRHYLGIDLDRRNDRLQLGRVAQKALSLD